MVWPTSAHSYNTVFIYYIDVPCSIFETLLEGDDSPRIWVVRANDMPHLG